jgi:hypothetical protein
MVHVQLQGPSKAMVQLDGLPIHEVATMDEASRKKLVNQLDGKMKYESLCYLLFCSLHASNSVDVHHAAVFASAHDLLRS